MLLTLGYLVVCGWFECVFIDVLRLYCVFILVAGGLGLVL